MGAGTGALPDARADPVGEGGRGHVGEQRCPREETADKSLFVSLIMGASLCLFVGAAVVLLPGFELVEEQTLLSLYPTHWALLMAFLTCFFLICLMREKNCQSSGLQLTLFEAGHRPRVVWYWCHDAPCDEWEGLSFRLAMTLFSILFFTQAFGNSALMAPEMFTGSLDNMPWPIGIALFVIPDSLGARVFVRSVRSIMVIAWGSACLLLALPARVAEPSLSPRLWRFLARTSVSVAGLTYIFLTGVASGSMTISLVFPDGNLHHHGPHYWTMTPSIALGIVVRVWGSQPSGWLQKYVYVILAAHYFNSGVAKMVHGACWEWWSGKHLEFLVGKTFTKYGLPLWLTIPASWAVLAFELLFPPCLLASRHGSMMRVAAVFVVIYFHVGVHVFMGIRFEGQLWLLTIVLPDLPATVRGAIAQQEHGEQGTTGGEREVRPIGLIVSKELTVQACVGTGVALMWFSQCGRSYDVLWPVSNMEVFSYPANHPAWWW